MSHDEALVERCIATFDDVLNVDRAPLRNALTAVLDLLAVEGRLVEPLPFYIAPDGDGDPAIWRERTDAPTDECVGIRFMTGNAHLYAPLAEWLWSVIPSREVTE